MKKEVILFIDTSSNKEVIVSLEVDGKKEEVRKELDKKRAQVVLPLIKELLTKFDLHSSAITQVQVITGPGSFTGLRVGVSIANMLGEYLHIPINGKPIRTIVTPQYS